MLFDWLIPSRRALRSALLPLPLLLLGPPGAGGLVVQFGEPARVEAGQETSALAVVGADARVDGTVRDALVVVDGRAEVSGDVLGDVVVVDGVLALADGARVAGDVTLFGAAIERAEGAAVAGVVESNPTVEVGRAAALFGWTTATLALVALALLVVALFGPAGGAVREAARSPGRTLLVGLGVVIGLPALAVVAFMTGIGLGLGALLLAVLPGLLVGGYVVAGVTVGEIALDRVRADWLARPWGPYVAAALGVAGLQVLAAVPVLGLVAWAAALAGAGALVVSAVRARPRRSGPTAPVAADRLSLAVS